jgi:hypothetical protein
MHAARHDAGHPQSDEQPLDEQHDCSKQVPIHFIHTGNAPMCSCYVVCAACCSLGCLLQPTEHSPRPCAVPQHCGGGTTSYALQPRSTHTYLQLAAGCCLVMQQSVRQQAQGMHAVHLRQQSGMCCYSPGGVGMNNGMNLGITLITVLSKTRASF